MFACVRSPRTTRSIHRVRVKRGYRRTDDYGRTDDDGRTGGFQFFIICYLKVSSAFYIRG